mmetsp:Transcript_18534/g.45922  ORF Transcript_18534/g.45922 Transcript_18534/m.45922 type:complete len:451 (-) Transcript_18534:524-1876(-)|eukprot:CAMPEP_0116080412 /NCGR_PEP_ID=MMETSP0327-20121206/1663_1 /TAXON_ID=44447 /ORGANISM="Pseudo-nitzschia delicatissima, Strain B596" /LENGTH=450 /DNA_ID=CAMNT_0003571105 /DNA_START=229 /DNA_END=1581 /DNA_ORIENTATION=+
MNNTAESSSLVVLNKALPPLRQDELNENSTRYEHLAAAPPDEDLVKYWYSWTFLALACGLFSLSVCLSIVLNKKVRQKPFNLYIIYLMIPDFVFSILCGITCLLNATNGAYYSHSMCNFQQFYVVFGIGANAWLNCVVAHQLHQILRNSSARRRYRLPTRKQVTIHSLSVYAWCLFLGSLGYNATEKFPFHSGQASGLACLPLEGRTTASALFFWVCFFPLFAGIPIAYVAWICWDIFFRNLMPPRGQRRLFTIYFGRLIAVFMIMWIPTILLMFIFSPWLPQWVDFVGGSWSHLQGGVSAFLILLKPDIQDAFLNFVTCRCDLGKDEDEDFSTRISSSRMSSRMMSSGYRGSYWWPRPQSQSCESSARPENTHSSVNLDTGFEADSVDDPENGLGECEDDIEECTLGEDKDSESVEESKPANECSHSEMKDESSPELCDNGDILIAIKG